MIYFIHGHFVGYNTLSSKVKYTYHQLHVHFYQELLQLCEASDSTA